MRPVLILFIGALLSNSADAELVRKTHKHFDAKFELHSYVVYDDAIAGTRPGVLVVHEWWGLNEYAKRRCDQLANEAIDQMA